MGHPPLATMVIDDTWAASDGRLDGRPTLIRIRQNLRPHAGHPQLPHRLRIVWEYELDNDSGMPSSDELGRMRSCEDLLVGAFEQDNHAILTHVLTCDGLRQWVSGQGMVVDIEGQADGTLPVLWAQR